MIETSFKAKIPTEFDPPFFYCPYIPVFTLKSNYSWLDEVKESEVKEPEKMSDMIYYKNGEETFRISPPTVGTKCPETKLEVKKMTDPDYKIEECFDPGKMKAYFVIYGMRSTPHLVTDREHKTIEYDTLDEAKECVRMLRKYKNRVFHYVED